MSVAPVRKEIVVEASQARAFRVFTEEPRRVVAARQPPHRREGGRDRDHRAARRRTLVRTRRGRHRMSMGQGAGVGPARRIVLSWSIGADFKYDPALSLELEIRFVALGAASTRIELEHRNLERLGDAAEGVRGADRLRDRRGSFGRHQHGFFVDGLMIAERQGALDPGVLLHLMRMRNMDADALTELLYGQSGLRSISGCRTICANCSPPASRRPGSPSRSIAARRQIGAGLAAIMGDVEAESFSLAELARSGDPRGHPRLPRASRSRARRGGEYCRRGATTRPGSSAEIYIVPANEERIIALDMAALLNGKNDE